MNPGDPVEVIPAPYADRRPPGPVAVPVHVDPVELGAFLKLGQACASGGQAKWLIQSGAVMVNGKTETRRRRSLKAGDCVALADGRTYLVVPTS
jgi:ribosome-associated protein